MQRLDFGESSAFVQDFSAARAEHRLGQTFNQRKFFPRLQEVAMSLQHILKPLGAAAAFALALYTVLVPHGAVSAPESALSAVSERPRAPMMDTIDNSRECDHAANVRERCIYN